MMSVRTQRAIELAMRGACRWTILEIGKNCAAVTLAPPAAASIDFRPVIEAALAAQTPAELRRRLNRSSRRRG